MESAHQSPSGKLPAGTEDEISWKIVEEMSAKRAKLLKPIFDSQRAQRALVHSDGSENLSQFRRDSGAGNPVQPASPNMIVKIVATRAGIVAIEEATYRG